mmetsp:Transcript_13537/g.28263  ORF Transcript_13537/g.28263 Transcript_13537/m.28263 type:complete len:314 (+) Transcript_13537:402-1343(+)
MGSACIWCFHARGRRVRPLARGQPEDGAGRGLQLAQACAPDRCGKGWHLGLRQRGVSLPRCWLDIDAEGLYSRMDCRAHETRRPALVLGGRSALSGANHSRYSPRGAGRHEVLAHRHHAHVRLEPRGSDQPGADAEAAAAAEVHGDGGPVRADAAWGTDPLSAGGSRRVAAHDPGRACPDHLRQPSLVRGFCRSGSRGQLRRPALGQGHKLPDHEALRLVSERVFGAHRRPDLQGDVHWEEPPRLRCVLLGFPGLLLEPGGPGEERSNAAGAFQLVFWVRVWTRWRRGRGRRAPYDSWSRDAGGGEDGHRGPH